MENKLECIHVNSGRTIIRPNFYNECQNFELTATPAEVLKVLMDNPDTLISYSDFIRKLWGRTKECNQKTIRLLDVYIHNVINFMKDCDVDYELLRVRGKYFYFKTQPVSNLLN